MKKHSELLEKIAFSYLLQSDEKPSFNEKDVLNILIIFNTMLTDKVHDICEQDGMNEAQSLDFATSAGNELKKVMFTYTGIDTFQLFDK